MIKVGFLVSYDFKYLYKSLPLVYKDADLIVLAVDKNGLTWSGNKISVDTALFEWIEKIDIENKIKIYYDDFYDSQISVAENDTRERNMLSKAMGEGGWHIQIDSDEYFNDFKGFTDFLKQNNKYLKNPSKNKVEIHVQWITLFKKVEGGFLYISDSLDAIEVATNYPKYKYMRATRFSNKIMTKFMLIHQSWARDEDEIETKILNWSHKDDSDNILYFNFWKSVSLSNYKEFHNFHDNDPTKWKSLSFVAEKDLNNLRFEVSNFDLKKQRIKKHIIHFIKNRFSHGFQNKIRLVLKKIIK